MTYITIELLKTEVETEGFTEIVSLLKVSCDDYWYVFVCEGRHTDYRGGAPMWT